MHIIELKIYKFLQEVAKGSYKIPQELLAKFGDETKSALKKQFEREERPFKLSMSSIGRATCQLEFEQAGIKGDNSLGVIRALYGDIVEDIVLFLLHASGIKVLSELQKTSVTVNDVIINGEYDVILEVEPGKPTVWDIKSASDYVFRNKFTDFEGFIKNDTFGYSVQLMGYAEGLGVQAGGWLIFDKSSGEIRVIQIPDEKYETLKERFYKKANDTVSRLSTSLRPKDSLPSQRSYEATEEIFNKQLTGNKLLPEQCTLCSFKMECWKSLVLKPQAKSKAKDKKLVWYVEYHEEGD